MSLDVNKQLNSNIEVLRIGNELQPLIVVDNFIAQPQALIEYALHQHDVLPAAGHYPGYRSDTPDYYARTVSEQYANLICQTFQLDMADIKQVESYYSLVATPVEQLSVVQRLPHFDKPNPKEIAIIHYLCNDTHGGTSFYRHRSSGMEFVDVQRSSAYLRKVREEVRTIGLPLPPAYINGNTALFELVTSIPAVFNRALIYRCSSLHSGSISDDYEFDFNPHTGRFTVASFLHK